MIQKQIPKFFDEVYKSEVASLITLEEVRDAFHTNQVLSKNCAIQAFDSIYSGNNRVLYIGSWFGVLTNYLLENYDGIHVDEVDMDVRCSTISRALNRWQKNFSHTTCDINKFAGLENYHTVINLSTEHMSEEWFHRLRPGTRVVMQCNNFDSIDDHINCCSSLQELQSKFNLTETTFAHTLTLNIYQRYTLAGIK